MYTMGLDFGSTASKGVVLMDGKEIIADVVVNSGTGTSGPNKVLKMLLNRSGLKRDDIKKTVVTGYGRMTYKDADFQISELSCHAKGAHFFIPSVRTVIDIGGQDVKILKLDAKGRLDSFVMNDKCAAGTGRFLEVMARVLEININDFSSESSKSKRNINISNTCTVFAESEVISHLANGVNRSDICAGIELSIVKKVSNLARRVGIEDDVAMTGGVANNSNIIEKMTTELKRNVIVPDYPQCIGAIGAALFGYEKVSNC